MKNVLLIALLVATAACAGGPTLSHDNPRHPYQERPLR